MGKIMGVSATNVALILLITMAIIIPCLEGGIAEFDDYLKAQAEEARKLTLQTYVPNPEGIAEALNLQVHRKLEDDTIRKELRQTK
ncbi:PREDICTED: probable pectate lyase 6 [Lupinus angustifolius]|uniref:probable pectate lyase 6 n=1 Tax=Lupinus angustifolius TaxID=3871 RepID=UPI00092FAF7D|nr:PREDICTED: probable pectate lyase 6 [Lupinus angustifolius]